MAVPSENDIGWHYKLCPAALLPLLVEDLVLLLGLSGKSNDLPAIKHFLTESSDD